MRPIALIVGLALVLSACGGTAAAPSPSPTPKPTVVAKVATDATFGKILVDQAGKTLYVWYKDIDEPSSQCYDACAGAWPPFIVETKTIAGDGVANGKLGTITRKDGKLQATYNTMPLYYFVRDTPQTPTTGHGSPGFGALWVVVMRP